MAGKLPYRHIALAHAKRYIGVKENPAGSNSDRGTGRTGTGPLIDRWCHAANGQYGYPWCAAFLCAMFAAAGRPIGDFRRASVGFLEHWSGQRGWLVTRPLRGDLICYRFDRDDWADHVGIIDRVLAVRWKGRAFTGLVRTVEGNTSAGNDANGGQVQVRYRWLNGRCRFIRVPGGPA